MKELNQFKFWLATIFLCQITFNTYATEIKTSSLLKEFELDKSLYKKSSKFATKINGNSLKRIHKLKQKELTPASDRIFWMPYKMPYKGYFNPGLVPVVPPLPKGPYIGIIGVPGPGKFFPTYPPPSVPQMTPQAPPPVPPPTQPSTVSSQSYQSKMKIKKYKKPKTTPKPDDCDCDENDEYECECEEMNYDEEPTTAKPVKPYKKPKVPKISKSKPEPIQEKDCDWDEPPKCSKSYYKSKGKCPNYDDDDDNEEEEIMEPEPEPVIPSPPVTQYVPVYMFDSSQQPNFGFYGFGNQYPSASYIPPMQGYPDPQSESYSTLQTPSPQSQSYSSVPVPELQHQSYPNAQISLNQYQPKPSPLISTETPQQPYLNSQPQNTKNQVIAKYTPVQQNTASQPSQKIVIKYSNSLSQQIPPSSPDVQQQSNEPMTMSTSPIQIQMTPLIPSGKNPTGLKFSFPSQQIPQPMLMSDSALPPIQIKMNPLNASGKDTRHIFPSMHYMS